MGGNNIRLFRFSFCYCYILSTTFTWKFGSCKPNFCFQFIFFDTFSPHYVRIGLRVSFSSGLRFSRWTSICCWKPWRIYFRSIFKYDCSRRDKSSNCRWPCILFLYGANRIHFNFFYEVVKKQIKSRISLNLKKKKFKTFITKLWFKLSAWFLVR